MALLCRLPLLVVIAVVPLGPLLSTTASASHNQLSSETATTTARRYHQPSPASTAAVHFLSLPSATPSVTGQSQPMLTLDRATVEAQAEAAEEAAAAAHPALLMPPQAAPPPPPLVSAPDVTVTSHAPPLQYEDSDPEGRASATAAPPLGEPAASTTSTALLPLPDVQRTAAAAASLPRPVKAGCAVARVVASDGEERMLHLERVLTALGYNEMASAAPLLANSPLLASWHGAITVFAAPDRFLHAACPMCSRRHLLLEHIALGYHPYSDLTATRTATIPSASIDDFCLHLATERSPFSIHYDARLFVEGVEVSHPELYNDGRYVVHGLHGFVRPHSLSPCIDYSHSQQCHDPSPTRSAATSVSSSAARVRIRIREAIARLRDRG